MMGFRCDSKNMAQWDVEYFKLKVFEKMAEALTSSPCFSSVKQATKLTSERCPPYTLPSLSLKTKYAKMQ